MNQITALIERYNQELRGDGERPMTQSRLAALAGMNPATVSRHVNNVTKIDLDQAIRYSVALKCRPEELVAA